MLRVVLTGIWIAFAAPSFGATLPVWTVTHPPQAAVTYDPFQEAIDAHALSYRDSPGAPPLPVLRMSVQLPLLMGIGWWIALILPSPSRIKRWCAYVACAALARSRIR